MEYCCSTCRILCRIAQFESLQTEEARQKADESLVADRGAFIIVGSKVCDGSRLRHVGYTKGLKLQMDQVWCRESTKMAGKSGSNEMCGSKARGIDCENTVGRTGSALRVRIRVLG